MPDNRRTSAIKLLGFAGCCVAILGVFVASCIRVETRYELGEAPLISTAVEKTPTPSAMEALLVANPTLLTDRDANSNMLLHNVVLEGEAEVVEVILENGCDVNARGLASLTPLDLAIRRGDPEIVRRLLSHGADPKQESGQRKPLDRARELGDEKIIRMIEAAMGQTERP